MNNYKSEILAPAGNMESVISALRCGADAVYVGGKEFSARQNADNFDFEELFSAAEMCHLFGAKIHLAVNIMLFDGQLEQFKGYITKCAEIGIDAFIVQDLGALQIIKQTLPNMPVHASTQMTIHSINGALYAKKLGFSRVVVARELSKEQIEEICGLGLEVEVFVQGALCMSVSGQCYMSAVIGSRSANRGLCAQACRLPFSATGDKDEYALSLKDLSLIQYVNEMREIGVTSFKIEGRMKRPEYVASAVTALYNALNGKTPDIEQLRAVFSRSGFTDGYYTDKRYKMFGIREKEDVVSAKNVLPTIKELYRKERKVTEINFKVSIKANTPLKLMATDSENNSIEISGDVPQIAQNKPTDIEQLTKQLSKLGNSIYSLGNIEAQIDKNLILPASAINDLRRRAVEMLDKKRIAKNTPHYIVNNLNLSFPKLLNIKFPAIRIRLEKYSQCTKLNLENIEQIILPMNEITNSLDVIPFRLLDKIVIAPPRFIVNETKILEELDELYENGFNKLLCNNPAYITLDKFERYGDFNLNIANSYSLKQLAENDIKDTVISLEMKLSQINTLADYLPYGIIAYGRLPLMLTRNCPIMEEVGCKNCTSQLIDRTSRIVTVACRKNSGYVELLNPDILYMADRLSEISDVSFMTLMFYEEAPQEVAEIVNQYIKGSANSPAHITRGLYYRGII